MAGGKIVFLQSDCIGDHSCHSGREFESWHKDIVTNIKEPPVRVACAQTIGRPTVRIGKTRVMSTLPCLTPNQLKLTSPVHLCS